MERLRTRKDEVAREVDRRRAVFGTRSSPAQGAPAFAANDASAAPPPLRSAQAAPQTAVAERTYEPPPHSERPEEAVPPPLPAGRRGAPAPEPQPAEEGYTSRLLKAKRNVKYTRGDSTRQPPGPLPDRLPDDLN
jgi:hypothetical protein